MKKLTVIDQFEVRYIDSYCGDSTGPCPQYDACKRTCVKFGTVYHDLMLVQRADACVKAELLPSHVVSKVIARAVSPTGERFVMVNTHQKMLGCSGCEIENAACEFTRWRNGTLKCSQKRDRTVRETNHVWKRIR